MKIICNIFGHKWATANEYQSEYEPELWHRTYVCKRCKDIVSATSSSRTGKLPRKLPKGRAKRSA